MLKCPSCRLFETPHQETKAWAAEEAKRLLLEHIDPPFVMPVLISHHYEAWEAESLLEELQEQMRQENRADGIRRCIWSFFLVVLSLLVLAASISSSASLSTDSVMMLLCSSAAFINGLLAVLTGRDDLFSPSSLLDD